MIDSGKEPKNAAWLQGLLAIVLPFVVFGISISTLQILGFHFSDRTLVIAALASPIAGVLFAQRFISTTGVKVSGNVIILIAYFLVIPFVLMVSSHLWVALLLGDGP